MAQLTKKQERRLAKLDALEAGGVDNWEWYDESLKDWHAENSMASIAESIAQDIFEILGGSAYEPSERGAGVAFDSAAMEQVETMLFKALKANREG